MEKPLLYTDESNIPPGAIRSDVFERSLHELFFVENPDIQKAEGGASEEAIAFAKSTRISSVWVYYQETNRAIRIPEEATYFRLRTARNRNLITDAEQQRYRSARVGIAGLSIGSTALAALVQTGGPKLLKIADPDAIEITNLNRIRATVHDVGANKADVAARAVWDVDPFADIEVWRAVNAASLEMFIGDPTLNVMIDEMDDIATKIEVRNVARRLRVPVVMATDNGDGAILDIERFDEEPNRPIFHGRVDIDSLDLSVMNRAAFVKLSTLIIDPKLFTERQLASLQEIGKSLSGVAQIATAAAIAGAAVAYAVRLITTGQSLPSGRYVIGCDSKHSVTIA